MKGLLLLLQIASTVYLVTSLLYVFLCSHLLVLFGLHVSIDALLHPHGILELLLEGVECLHGLARVQLQREQLLISLIDVLNVLLILDLELMEIDELQVVSHFFFVLDLGLSFGDLCLERGVLEGKLANQGILGTLLVFHVLHKLFSVVLSSSAILGSRQESTEIEGFLSNLSNGQVGTFQDSLKPLEKSLRAISSTFNTLLECLELGIGYLVLLLGSQLSLVVDESTEKFFFLNPLLLRLLSLALVVLLLLLFLHLSCDVGFEQLILTANLLIVLLDVDEFIVKLLKFHVFE